MATGHTGNVSPSIELEEHRSLGGVNVKAVTPYIFSGGALVPQVGSLVPEGYDSITATYPTTSTEQYVYKSGVTTVATLTVTYTDSTKAVLSSVVRT